MREVNKGLFGEEVINRTKEVWGMDSEGELSGSYRSSGYPGVCLFFSCGDYTIRNTYFVPFEALVCRRRLYEPAIPIKTIGVYHRIWSVGSLKFLFLLQAIQIVAISLGIMKQSSVLSRL